MSAAGRRTVRSPATSGDAATELAHPRSAEAVRQRCHMVGRWVAEGRSPHFVLHRNRLADVADYVAKVTREAYPNLTVPLHSRWRHFSAGGVDRWGFLAKHDDADGAIEQARKAVDLATVSVLLDAGAGDRWQYREHATGLTFTRSEGLAVASLDMFVAGGFSSDRQRPLQADAVALKCIDDLRTANAFQVSENNPLVGVAQRAALLRRCGQALEARSDVFGRLARPGHLVDHLVRSAREGQVSATEVLNTLLETLSSIWSSGLIVDGVNIGDAGLHPAVRTGDATEHIVPFHKLSQWLTYSLIEPLAMAGLTLIEVDGLTALAEYRNGGLLIDLGVIEPRKPIERRLEVSSEQVVEWRALTVALMDDLLDLVRARLGVGAAFAMPHLMQGGTWSAGRKIACALRPPDGQSPISLVSDGTLF